jgi:hypothetical protein
MSSYMCLELRLKCNYYQSNDNTQSNFVYVGSGFDHQLELYFSVKL